MFSPDIVESEEFLTMPLSSQALYFHLGMEADDDGFIQPKIMMRSIGANDDDLRVLLGKRFLLPFETGVVVIKHWLIHNMIRLDRYKPTRFQEEKNRLIIKENKAYTERKDDVGCQIGNQLTPQVRLGEVRLGEERVEEPQFKKTVDELWIEMIEPFKNKYAPSMIQAFEIHFRQKNPDGKKELWQMERVFDINLRLKAWKNRQEKWDYQNQAKKNIPPENKRNETITERKSNGLEKISFNQFKL